MRIRPPQAISYDEFARMFRRCTPPRMGWSPKIGVANSGGPDSTCLLFLIHRHLAEDPQVSKQDLPRSVVSLTVDHDLQESSAAMAEHCAKVARSIGADHLTSKIPWSEAPYPPRPSPGQMFENIARNARYHSLFAAMTHVEVGVIAFGHHADDQVETSLMRLGRGTTELGAGGMRRCRRWGMGMGKDENSLAWAGYEGMKRWIMRPLLDVSKDRILATCEANNLEYVTDKTNFQPHITLRNALRHRIQGINTGLDSQAGEEPVPTDIAEKLASIEKAVSSLKSVSVTLDSGADQLRSAVSVLTSNVEDIDSEVDSILKRSQLPSFPGTYLISSRGISKVRDDVLRKAMILRIMRYISFHPWGSIRADGNRRKHSLDQIIEKIWDPSPFRSIFVAGGGVLWTPVSVRGNRIKTPDRVAAAGVKLADETFGWLASRQPPVGRQKLKERGIPNTLEIEVTSNLIEALKNRKNGGHSIVQILYDCRFLVHFDLEKIPEDLATQLLLPRTEGADKIMLYSRTRWYWPMVVREESTGTKDVLHSKIDENPTNLLLQGEETDCSSYWRPHDAGISSQWITIEWIRSLDAL
ncbi:tRNA(Ile)-lysidine synthase [Hypsizygus marmoreus]|uniref:tRNA(Ile)-lysidine synthetase n=1 Tax=Hypsizygus marmoreus TaxID=39966 RepID=A0A369JIE2_HYPMA|nr:tRNA(Ile)-lysidine synthase [Hypsizygus marmoreus]